MQKHNCSSTLLTIKDTSDVLLPDVLLSRCSAWREVEVVQFHQTFKELSVPAKTEHKLTVNLTDRRHVIARIGNDLYERRLEHRSVALIPAGQPSEWRNAAHAECKVLQLYLQPTFLNEVANSADLNPDKVELISQLGVYDPQVEHIALALLAELEAGCPSGRLYGESAATMLAIHLLRRYSAFEPNICKYKGGLPQYKLRQILEYINDNLERDLSLAELAAVLSLSLHHFARQFKQTVGVAPHEYVIKQRVERAKQLLAHSDLPIADVAIAVGCVDQSHFGRLFRRLVGVSPSAYRKAQ